MIACAQKNESSERQGTEILKLMSAHSGNTVFKQATKSLMAKWLEHFPCLSDMKLLS